jgi:hypothetical protein
VDHAVSVNIHIARFRDAVSLCVDTALTHTAPIKDAIYILSVKYIIIGFKLQKDEQCILNNILSHISYNANYRSCYNLVSQWLL